MSKLAIWLACFCLGCSAVSQAQSVIPEAVEKDLANGLKVIVQEDHRSPVAVFQIWYGVGSADEVSGHTGLSHLLEHLMFKGTPQFPGDSFAKKIAANGGNHNAGTSNDYTVYYESLKADRLETSFELEADRMDNLLLTQEEFLPERAVVQEERRLRVDDNPNAVLFERFRAMAYLSSGYHHPVIGWMDDITHLTVNDAQLWYKNWYGPNNAAIVVVGDVEPEHVFSLAEKYFAKKKTIVLPERKPRAEQRPLGERRFVVKLPARLPQLLMGYPTPAATTAVESYEPYALYVLASVLGGGDSARLSKDLVRGQQLAVQASAYYDFVSKAQGLFLLSAIPSESSSVAKVETALRQQIKTLQEETISSAELTRIKTGVIADNVYSKDSISERANLLGNLHTVGLPWQLEHQFVNNIKEVTAEQVQAVAKKYLLADSLTLGVLEPTVKDKPER